MKKLHLVALVLALSAIPAATLAHQGGTDAMGGHYCRTNCEQWGLKMNEYHFHDETGINVATYENNKDVYDLNLAKRLHGRILLQVEDHGEAWYIRSKDSKRYYMQNGDVAYQMMRFFSLGISDADLAKIPAVTDATEMNNSTSICSTNSLANRLRGEILLQVQQRGEAWYIDPVKCRRIYMENGLAAYEIMRFLGLGIKNIDLNKIVIGTTELAQ